MPWYLRKMLMEEAGGEEFGGASGGDETGATDGGEGVEPSSTGPSSMLEAIESGLSGTEEKVETEAEKTERLRDEQGRFAAKEAKPEGDPAKPTEPPKHDDELAMPEGLSQKAQERFTKLVSRVKEHEAQVAEVSGTLNQFREMIQSTGTTPQEFSQAIDYMRMVKHGDFEGALRIMDDQRRMLSLAMGKPLPGADPLAQFPDLRQRVDGYLMDEHTAIELARSRVMNQSAQQAQQQQMQTQQQVMHEQQTKAQAIQQIDQLGQQWARSDPDFTVKEDIILKQLPEIARTFPPAQWAQQVRILYNTLSAMPMQQQRQVTTPAPLRPSGQQAGARQPKSMLEAMEMGLGYAGG
jgi:hypothetical protein